MDFQEQLSEVIRQYGSGSLDETRFLLASLRAPEIAAGLSTDGVRVGRTSHRLRNPANAPRPWMEPVLAELRAALEASVSPT